MPTKAVRIRTITSTSTPRRTASVTTSAATAPTADAHAS
jgi:hypothetical protein